MASNIVHVLTFMLIINTVLALTCYQCNSTASKLCSYGILSFTYNTVDCDEQYGKFFPKQCVKLVVEDQHGNEHIVRDCIPRLGRGCASIAKELSFFARFSDKISDVNCYPCDSDKCNSASKPWSQLTDTVLLISTAVLFMLL